MSSTPTATGCEELRAALKNKLERGEIELPVLPETARDLLRAADNPDSDARTVADILHRDALVAGHLLRLANSPLYRPRMPIVSLQQAVTRLGFARIREIALTIACGQRMFRVPGHESYAKQLFHHSFATGVIAQELARHKRWNVEQAYLTGLLHDVGKPVALQELCELARKLHLEASTEDLRSLAHEFHETIAESIIRTWKFSDVVADVIGHHHSTAEQPGCADLMMLLRFADDLAQHLFGPRAVSEEEVRGHAIARELNLYPEDVDRLLAVRETIAAALEELR